MNASQQMIYRPSDFENSRENTLNILQLKKASILIIDSNPMIT